MAIEVTTKDCTQLSDAELAEMADICADGPSRFEAGLLSKQAEAWVLVSLAREGAGPEGLLLLHAGAHRRHPERAHRPGLGASHLQAGLGAAGADGRPVPPGGAGVPRRGRAGGHPFRRSERLRGVQVPRGHRPPARAQGSGEERAWGRRLAKRFGVDSYDDRSFVASGDGAFPLALDHESLKPEKLEPGIDDFFAGVDPARGDSLIAFGWAMAEDLAKLR